MGLRTEGFIITANYLPTPSYYWYGTFPMYASAFAYDATSLLLWAVDQVAEIDGEGGMHIPIQKLRDFLTGTRNFYDVTGILSCSAQGDCADPNVLRAYEIEYPYP